MLKVVRTHAYGLGHLFLVQVLKIVRTQRAFVHMFRDVDTCCLFKCLRSSMDFTLIVCSSAQRRLYTCVCTYAYGLYTCCLFKCLRSFMDFTLVVCSSA
jgi:hypothetical protein